MSAFHKLTIKTITKETPNCVTLEFEVPEHLKNTFTFTSGQYITLKTTINDTPIRRDYSLCTSANSGVLKVAIKAVENGVFSTYANTQLKTNTTLEVAPPNGRFVFTPIPNAKRVIAAFAAGSGITPILSIAKTVLENESESEFVLVYGNKSIKDTIFFNELIALQKQYANRLHLQFLFSQTQEKEGLFGRIEKSTVNLIVKNKFKNATIDTFYLCGPSKMIDTVKETLIENNIDANRIKFELFTAQTTPNTESPTTNNALDGNAEITVIVDDEAHTFTMSAEKTILEAALKHDLDAPYSCQGGICSSCIARVTEGSATMQQNNILTDSEIADGLVLTCQAYPKSATLKVDYDDI